MVDSQLSDTENRDRTDGSETKSEAPEKVRPRDPEEDEISRSEGVERQVERRQR